MMGKIVRCIYNFSAETETDLEIKPGDLVRVIKIINSDWYEGELNGRKGQFPSAYVEECDDVFDLVVAVKTFVGDQDGDLSFNEGDFIVVTEILDENWMQGYIQGGDKGMFPRTFVKEVSSDDPISAVEPSQSNEDDISKEEENKCEAEESGLEWVSVLENFSAMDDTELDLCVGTKVQVLYDVDDFWCKGISEGGKEGIFPRNFVDLPEISKENQGPVGEKKEQTEKTLSATGDEGQSSPTPTAKGEEESEKNETEDNNIIIGKTVALFDFLTDEKGDLSFNSGDEVLLLEIINDNWMRGQIEDRIGIFPCNYVEVKEMYSSNDSKSAKETVSSEIEENNDKNISETSSDNQCNNVKPDDLENKTASSHSNNVSNNNNKKTSSSDSRYENVSVPPKLSLKPKPPTKPGKPQRPKLPESKKPADEITPFSYNFKTKSQPLVIIPPKYFKPGSSNIVILKNRKKHSTTELEMDGRNS